MPAGARRKAGQKRRAHAAFLEVHRRLVSGKVDTELSGSTAVACLLRGRRLTTAWAGAPALATPALT
jgi:hypothetical protein